MEIQVRPWDVEDAMALHQLSMHPYYLKKRPWKLLYPDSFLNAVSTIHFYQNADESRYLYRTVTVDERVAGYLSCENRTGSDWELSYWLGADLWNQGIMKEAIHQLCEEVFSLGYVMMLYACVKKENIASRHVLKHNGFQEEAHDSLYIYKRYR